jgi:hypothetical protein
MEGNSTCFGQLLCASSGVTHNNGICHIQVFLTACKQHQDGTFWSCLQAVSKPVWHTPLLCVQWKTPDDGQWNCLKHAEFHSKNKFEKLVHLVGFIIGNLAWCTVTRMSKSIKFFSLDSWSTSSWSFSIPCRSRWNSRKYRKGLWYPWTSSWRRYPNRIILFLIVQNKYWSRNKKLPVRTLRSL